MPHKIELGPGGDYILPASVITSAGRQVEVKRPDLLIIYPDNADTESIVKLIEAYRKKETETT